MKHLISPCRLYRQGGPNLRFAVAVGWAGARSRAPTRRFPTCVEGPARPRRTVAFLLGRRQCREGQRKERTMGLPPGEIAPGSVSPAPAAEGLTGPDGPASIEGTADTDGSAAVRGPAGMPEPGFTHGSGGTNAPGANGPGANGPGANGPGGAEGAGRLAAPWRPVVPRARPATGDPRVDDAVARLDDLDGLPITEHLAVF